MLPLIVFFALASPLNNLNKVGEAEFSVMFLDIYDIALYSDTGTYHQGTEQYALTIEYHRNVSATRLLDLTQDQWQHLEVPESTITQYAPVLQDMWPDIEKGDSLTIKVSPDSSQFYHNETVIGAIEDARFGKLFTDIWLSPDTSAPRIRRDLLGQD
ncbi:hypothetical protein GCM10011403_09620 [Pseudohongiella nitratireducens]|jgi:hypothetical protein|uniref:Chalcone isomerase domain-containing protein n=1 Tax=Pseudohongiella nitratireducens TaxID=1768907 RepID=A0A917GQR0_9GAMM|nr:chalcone isomerase family protein [Pseudohongiella nitratireducens]MDF1624417.1 chalcone isomerase family protein [Pseudohongiella nitratireducens]GGG54590.1 hypothetical protein GCM10011403_09620 [Pseudohongiella nitratireducens]